MKNTIPLIRILTSWLSFRGRCMLIILVLAASALLPAAHAVNPPPDGGYAGLNTAEGQNALLNLDTSIGFANTAVGALSLQSNVDAGFNTGVGAGTLSLNTGNENTAVGAAALLLNTTGEANTAVGVGTLLNNSTGEANTAIGDGALSSNTEGNNDTANGSSALKNNTTGDANTANGVAALESNTEGALNTATGEVALTFNITGSGNTANGVAALLNNIDGNSNTANGLSALHDNTSGSSNTADGDHALFENVDGTGNTAVGAGALSSVTSGSSNTALGENAGHNLFKGDSNNIDIGFDVQGVAGESNTIRIGNSDITTTIIRGISGQTIPSGAAVLVAANGQLGTVTSSGRFKEDIKPMDKASEALFSLKPVTFRYKKEIDPAGAQQLGLVAEDVAKINPDLVVRDENGNVNSVRYDQVNAMLLNEFLKEHRRNQDQQATISELKLILAEQESRLAHQEKKVAMLTAAFKRVCTQHEISRPASRLSSNSN